MDISIPFPRLTWEEAMNRYGSDKPDNRFAMELQDITEPVSYTHLDVYKRQSLWLCKDNI